MSEIGTAGNASMKTSFTDVSPIFPYQSTEATRYLGVPDSPEIHLAIASLAERLLVVVQNLECKPEHKRIAALRCASGAVLFGYPWEHVELDVLSRLGVDITEQAWSKISELKRIDWLGTAAEMLRSEGVVVDPNFRNAATMYGWRNVNG